MKILITGATGFIGSHITAQALMLGYDVTIGCRSSSSFSLLQSVLEYYSGNPDPEEKNRVDKLKAAMEPFKVSPSPLSEFNDFKPTALEMPEKLILDDWPFEEIKNKAFEAIIHCAAIVSFEKSMGYKMIEENIQLTRDVVNTCVFGEIPNLLHISSIAALGRPENDKPISIKNQWVESRYNTDYAKSKYYSELEVWRGKEEGLNVLILNPGVVLGFGLGNTSHKQVMDAVSPKNPFYPIGSNGFVFVEDVAHNALRLLSGSVFGNRHLLVSHNVPFKDLTEMIAQIKKIKSPHKPLVGFNFKTALKLARFCEFFRIPFPVSSELLISTYKKSVYVHQ